MSEIVGYFEHESQILKVTAAAASAGHTIVDAYTPYAVHGLDEAMGMRSTRLPWICFAAGLSGGSVALGFQLWTSASSWRLNVGGKPFASIPAFIPVTFELTVLSAALVTAAALLIRSRLFPGKRVSVLPRVTDDRFALVLAGDGAVLTAFLSGQGAAEIRDLGLVQSAEALS